MQHQIRSSSDDDYSSVTKTRKETSLEFAPSYIKLDADLSKVRRARHVLDDPDDNTTHPTMSAHGSRGLIK